MITETIHWIPVEERLPEVSKEVLVMVRLEDGDHYFNVAYIRPAAGRVTWYEPAYGCALRTVTHWAEIKGPGCRQKED